MRKQLSTRVAVASSDSCLSGRRCRRVGVRLLVAGLTLSAGSIALVGTAGALPGPGYDPPFEDFGVVQPCWQLPQGCVLDPGDPVDPTVEPPADPPADDPGTPTTDPGTPTNDPGTPTNPGGGTGGNGPSTGAPTGTGTEPAPAGSGDASTESVSERTSAATEASDSNVAPAIGIGIVGAATAALLAVLVARRRRSALH